jgi:enamine deaminase RidA (YjgF/YER057c/UK114 family)
MVLAVVVASVAAFVVSSIWYTAFGRVWAQLSTAGAVARPSPWRMCAEFGRTLLLVTAFAILAAAVGVDGVPGALGLALVAWAGFPVVILAGSVLHERVPVRLAALHAGDWLVKITVVAAIVGAWR